MAKRKSSLCSAKSIVGTLNSEVFLVALSIKFKDQTTQFDAETTTFTIKMGMDPKILINEEFVC